MPGSGALDEHGNDLAVLDDELAEAVTGLAPGTQKVLIIEHLMGDFPIRSGLGEMDFKRTASPSSAPSGVRL